MWGGGNWGQMASAAGSSGGGSGGGGWWQKLLGMMGGQEGQQGDMGAMMGNLGGALSGGDSDSIIDSVIAKEKQDKAAGKNFEGSATSAGDTTDVGANVTANNMYTSMDPIFQSVSDFDASDTTIRPRRRRGRYS